MSLVLEGNLNEYDGWNGWEIVCVTWLVTLNGKIQGMEQDEEFDSEEEGVETASDVHHDVEAVEKIEINFV